MFHVQQSKTNYKEAACYLYIHRHIYSESTVGFFFTLPRGFFPVDLVSCYFVESLLLLCTQSSS